MYKTIKDIMDANRAAGHLWFDPSEMEWWGCKVDSTVYPVHDGAYFVSEDENPEGVRRRTVRFCGADGRVETVGDFHCWATKEDAHKAAQRYVRDH